MKAKEVEGERFGGKKVWKAIRDMQRGRRGLIPSRAVSILDESGAVCESASAQHQRWRRHFTNVLNIRSQFDEEELDKVEQREVCESLGVKPTPGEVRQALAKLKNGKAAGSSEILPEMLKAGKQCEDFVEMISDLVSAVWEERCVPQEWTDAILIPIPKKGNLQCYDNWRGIALLDVVGKLVARVVQGRLQKLAEIELPESQCGFRRGRGCTDMIFVVRQLAEKAIEHQTKQFFVFVDLRKAYDSVPREALWIALQKLGVPDILVDIIKSFHTDMQSCVRIDGQLLEEIRVNNGLRQGCTMAPSLFNLYACVVAERWIDSIGDEEDVGTRLLYKLDRQLFRRYTKNASELLVNKGEFADDVVLLASTRHGAETAIRAYSDVARAFGLSVSLQKTKFMVVGHGVSDEDRLPLSLGQTDIIERVSSFPYLGSLMSEDGRSHEEVDRRIAGASRAFRALRRAVFKDSNLSIQTKRAVYQACVLAVLLYGSECWVPLRKDLNKLNAFHHRCVRSILGITNERQWAERISLASVREQWGDIEIIRVKLIGRCLEWLGHLARMPEHRLPKVFLFGWLPAVRPFKGPRRRWRDQVKKDIEMVGCNSKEWYNTAQDRCRWKDIWSQSLGDIQSAQDVRRSQVCCVMSVDGASVGRVIKPVISALLNAASQCMSKQVLYGVGFARNGSGAGEA